MLWYKGLGGNSCTDYFEPVPDIGTCHLKTSYATHAKFLIWLRCILTMGKGKNSDLSILVIGGSMDDNQIDPGTIMCFKIFSQV